MPMTRTYTTLDGVILSERENGVTKTYVSDPQGSVIGVLDESGNELYSATYWPYGEIRTETGTRPAFGFLGALGYMRDFMQLLYVRARYLRTDLGRWMTVDPLWPGEPAYGYARNAPVTLTDQSGMGTQVEIIGHPDDKEGLILEISGRHFVENLREFLDCVGRACANGGITPPSMDQYDLEHFVRHRVWPTDRLKRIIIVRGNRGGCTDSSCGRYDVARREIVLCLTADGGWKPFCRTMPCVLLHELLHVLGYSHDPPNMGARTEQESAVFDCVNTSFSTCRNMVRSWEY